MKKVFAGENCGREAAVYLGRAGKNRYFGWTGPLQKNCPTALLGRAAFAAYERFAGGKTSAEGWLCHPEHLNHRRAERALGPRSPKRKTRYKRVFLFGIPRQSRYFQPLSDKFPMWDCRTYPSYNEVQDHQTFEYKAAQILWMCTDTVYREAEIDHFLLSE